MKSLKKLESRFGNYHPQVAEVCNALGMLAKKEGHYKEAQSYYGYFIRNVCSRQKCDQDWETLLWIETSFTWDVPYKFGRYSPQKGQLQRSRLDSNAQFVSHETETTYFQAISTLKAALGPDHIEVAEVLNSQGLVLKKVKSRIDKKVTLLLRELIMMEQNCCTNVQSVS